MTIFWIWIILLIIGFTSYFSILKFRHKAHSPFRIRLTIFFLLFVLLPSIPSAFLISQLLTQSADILIMPGMDEALDAGLDAIRQQAETRGRIFLQDHEDSGQWTETTTDIANLHLLGHYRLHCDSVLTMKNICLPSLDLWKPAPGQIQAACFGHYSQIIEKDQKGRIAVFHCLGDSSVTVAMYDVASPVLKAKNEMTRALRFYASLSLIKESMLEQEVIWALAVAAIFILAMTAAGAASTISRHISRPVQDLVAGMNKVAEGDLSIRVHTPAKDEFRRLVDAFNQMTADLAEGRIKLIKAEKLAAWQGVARQISHEIKNSLTPIAISIRRLRGHFGTAEMPLRVADSLQIIEEELKSMELMAGEFSEFARMPKASKTEIEINIIIQKTCDLLRSGLDGRRLDLNLDPNLPNIKADSEQIKRVLNNLIKNAIEATKSGDIITISSTQSMLADKNILIEITDTGIGMNKETLMRIFEPYFTNKKRGTGLGMAIVQQIIQQHNGHIDLSSQPGSGTQFQIHL
ncbi:HAMP domain-containing protein [bacterium]|nr:HAMP domain-containing protein [bacterium]